GDLLRGGFRPLGQCVGKQRIGPLGRGGMRVGGDRVDDAASHHITSMSAWMAPAALIACKMLIMSRGPMPSPLRPSTSCCSDTPSFMIANFLPSSDTATFERGVVTVRPRDSGAGWLTCGLSEIVTVRL